MTVTLPLTRLEAGQGDLFVAPPGADLTAAQTAARRPAPPTTLLFSGLLAVEAALRDVELSRGNGSRHGRP